MLRHYGESAQLLVAIEEMSELIKEIVKHLRGKGDKEHIAEELADVYVVLEYIKKIFGVSTKEIEERGLNKLYREESRIDGKPM